VLSGSSPDPLTRLGDTLAMTDDAIFVSRQAAGAEVFVRPLGGWRSGTPTTTLVSPDGPGIVLAARDDTLATRVYIESSDRGVIWLFRRAHQGWGAAAPLARLTVSDRYALQGTGPVALSDTQLFFGAYDSTGDIYQYDRPAGKWRDAGETGTLPVSAEARRDGIGFSLALAHDTLVAGAPGLVTRGSGTPGEVYVFEPSTVAAKSLVSKQRQRGTAVAGRVTIASANSTVTERLLARGPTGANASRLVLLGPARQRRVQAGVLRFRVRLNPTGRRLLARQRRLRLTIDVRVQPPQGTQTDLRRNVRLSPDPPPRLASEARHRLSPRRDHPPVRRW
jgi:hypothetical protein